MNRVSIHMIYACTTFGAACVVFSWGIPPLQSDDWNLSCDHGT